MIAKGKVSGHAADSRIAELLRCLDILPEKTHIRRSLNMSDVICTLLGAREITCRENIVLSKLWFFQGVQDRCLAWDCRDKEARLSLVDGNLKGRAF